MSRKLWLQFSFRATVVVIALIGLLIAMTTPAILPSKDIECFEDQVFIATTQVNTYFRTHGTA